MKHINVMISGADDTVSPEDLRLLSLKYPFVQWGILHSCTARGTSRYPSAAWLKELHDVRYVDMYLVAHLCGTMARSFATFRGEYVPYYDAVQLDLNGEMVPDEDTFCSDLDRLSVIKVILQVPSMDVAVDRALSHLHRTAQRQSPLGFVIDASRGNGRYHPGAWGRPHEAFRRIGYAGGITPDNVAQAFTTVSNLVSMAPCAAQNGQVWIDMETGVRTKDEHGDRFDLNKVAAVLETVARLRA